MGELGDICDVVANNVLMTIRWSPPADSELLSRFKFDRGASSMTVNVGQLLSGSTRTVPLMFDVPGLPLGQAIDVEVVVEGCAPKGADPFETVWAHTRLTAVPPAESRAADRNLDVAERIARLWQSTVGFNAMRLNEAGDFAGARRTISAVCDSMCSFADGTAAARQVRENLRAAKYKVSREWNGRSKRQSMIAAKKFSKGERDHRSGAKGDWSEHL